MAKVDSLVCCSCLSTLRVFFFIVRNLREILFGAQTCTIMACKKNVCACNATASVTGHVFQICINNSALIKGTLKRFFKVLSAFRLEHCHTTRTRNLVTRCVPRPLYTIITLPSPLLLASSTHEAHWHRWRSQSSDERAR